MLTFLVTPSIQSYWTPRHPVCELIIKHCHERVKHNGVQETLMQLRARFWIIKERSFIHKVIHQCIVCCKLEGIPYKLPLPPPLPAFRVKDAPPFSFTGLDFAGPLFMQSKESSDSTMVWIALYTCCVVRAVHLNLVPDLSTGTFLNSFRRFTARREFPLRVVSDNWKTFKSTAITINRSLSMPEVQKHFGGLRISWTFNLERAPWWEGFFERMIKSVKRCLRKTMGNTSLTHDELLMALVEVEMALNSRPHSFVSSEDLEEPLTPSHLLIGCRILSLPSHSHKEDPDFKASVPPDNLIKRMRHLD